MNMMLEAWLAGYLKDAIEDKTIKIFFFHAKVYAIPWIIFGSTGRLL